MADNTRSPSNTPITATPSPTGIGQNVGAAIAMIPSTVAGSLTAAAKLATGSNHVEAGNAGQRVMNAGINIGARVGGAVEKAATSPTGKVAIGSALVVAGTQRAISGARDIQQAAKPSSPQPPKRS